MLGNTAHLDHVPERPVETCPIRNMLSSTRKVPLVGRYTHRAISSGPSVWFSADKKHKICILVFKSNRTIGQSVNRSSLPDAALVHSVLKLEPRYFLKLFQPLRSRITSCKREFRTANIFDGLLNEGIYPTLHLLPSCGAYGTIVENATFLPILGER